MRALREGKGASAGRGLEETRGLRRQRRARKGTWGWGAKPRRSVATELGSQYALGQAQLPLPSCHDCPPSIPSTPFYQSGPFLPGLEWEDGEPGGGEQKMRASR